MIPIVDKGELKNTFLKLRGKWRLFWGLCPACNSDAPELYDCTVCQWYRTSERGMPDKTIKQAWWERYLKLLNFNNYE